MGNKEINNNGFEYVDLELPSGTLWATCNVGASKPSDYGLYFQWGDTQGYTKDQVGKDKQFTWNDYKFSINGSNTDYSKYANDGEVLELEDDAARSNMGGNWHMPSPKQIQELIDNTTSTWEEMDGVKGRLFTSIKDASKSIFIPAAGDAWDGSVGDIGIYGFIWSSARHTYYTGSQGLDFDSEGTSLYGSGSRYNGVSARGVIG